MTDSLWGDRKPPPGGYQVGDTVGILHSDHDDYVFDDPVGVITDVQRATDPDDEDQITVQVAAQVGAGRVFLIASYDPNDAAAAAGG